MAIQVEDEYHDILTKAMRGLNITDTALAEQTDAERADIVKVRKGTFDEATVREIAPTLNLCPDRLVAIYEGWRPKPVEMEGVKLINSKFEGIYDCMTVNAFIVWDAQKRAAIFDTGTEFEPILSTIKELGLKPEGLFITHNHRDHVAVLDKIRWELKDLPVHIHNKEAIHGARPFLDDEVFTVGDLKIEARLTDGHTDGGTTFVVTGLEHTLAIVGDALFAGSAGGAGSDWQHALKQLNDKVLSLPDDTIICPGHGPMSTVGEEKTHNPLFAKR